MNHKIQAVSHTAILIRECDAQVDHDLCFCDLTQCPSEDGEEFTMILLHLLSFYTLTL